MVGKVVISGPASWNRIVLLEHLPQPVPHMQFALGDHETVGGTSAGKALGLAALGREVELFTLIGPDSDGDRLREVLGRVGEGVALVAGHRRDDAERPEHAAEEEPVPAQILEQSRSPKRRAVQRLRT